MQSMPVDSSGNSANIPFANGENSSADEAWKTQAKKLFLDLNTSDEEILNFIYDELAGGDTSPAKQQAMTYLLNLRAQLTSFLSNTLRTLFDASNAIIRNLR